jgi:hypothetical protein
MSQVRAQPVGGLELRITFCRIAYLLFVMLNSFYLLSVKVARFVNLPNRAREPMSRQSRIENVVINHALRYLGVVLAIACLLIAPRVEANYPKPFAPNKQANSSRRAQLVEANIIAVQAYQIILARSTGGASNACYPETSPDTATLQDLVKHQQSLLAEPSEQVAR